MKTVEGAHGFIGKEHPVPGDGIADWEITKVCRQAKHLIEVWLFSVGFCMSSAIRMYLYNIHCLAVQGKKRRGTPCPLGEIDLTCDKIE